MTGRVLLLWRIAARDLRVRPVESLMVFLVIAAAATTLTVAFALAGVTNHPYQQTRAATAGPDVLAVVFTGLPNPNGGPSARPSSNRSSADRTPVPQAVVSSLLDAPGVARHSGPFPSVDGTIDYAGHRVDVIAEGRDRATAAVDQPKLTSGGWVRPGGVVLERGLADALGAHLGEPVQLGGRTLRVVGIAVTAAVPAYPSSLCHLACLMETPQSMGLIWITRSAATQLADRPTSASYLIDLKLTDPSHAAAFVRAHQGASAGGATAVLYQWQSIRGADDSLIHVEQLALQFGGWLLGLLALAGLAVLVGRRMTEQMRRVGLLKAIGATPMTVALVLLIEHLVIALAAAAVGLAAGWLIAPALSNPGAGLLGAAGTPSMSTVTVLLVAAAAIGVAVISALVPALRAARTSTMAALADQPRAPSRRPLIVAVSARLPVPLLLGMRQLARRPRRALLNATSVGVTATGIVAILCSSAHTHAAPTAIANVKIERLNDLMLLITVMLLVLAVINTTFIAWATAADGRFSSALQRALGATAGQLTAGASIAALLPAVPAALAGLPLGIEVYRLLTSGGPLTTPPVWQLSTVVIVSLVLVTTLTSIPSLLASRRPPAAALQSQ